MGLIVDFDGVIDQSKVWPSGSKEASPVATVVSVETLVVGLDWLNEDNIDLFYERSIRCALARGAGPWVLKKWSRIESTYISYDQLRDFLGMRTNAKVLSNDEFDKKCLEYLKETSDRALKKAKEPLVYTVAITIKRLRPFSKLDKNDRRFFWKAHQGNTATKWFEVVEEKGWTEDDIGQDAIRQFDEEYGNILAVREDYQVTVTRIALNQHADKRRLS